MLDTLVFHTSLTAYGEMNAPALPHTHYHAPCFQITVLSTDLFGLLRASNLLLFTGMNPPSDETIPPGHHIALPTDSPPPKHQTSPRSSSGWDGKLRVEKKAEVVNGDIGSDYSDEDAPPVEQIAADEGECKWGACTPPTDMVVGQIYWMTILWIRMYAMSCRATIIHP